MLRFVQHDNSPWQYDGKSVIKTGKNSRKENMKTFAATIAVIVLAGITASLPMQAQNSAPDKEYKLPPGLARELIDTKADPCVDFFQYACGNFSKLYPIPNDRSSFESFAMMEDHTCLLYTSPSPRD